MSNKSNSLTTKRFIIRKSLLGKNTVITFTNKKGDKITYDHDKVYNVNKERFESMNCFKKYKSYTNTNNIPTFCRDLSQSLQKLQTKYDYSWIINMNL